jgi:hypothetical protein
MGGVPQVRVLSSGVFTILYVVKWEKVKGQNFPAMPIFYLSTIN